MNSWVRTFTSPFRKACTFLTNQDPSPTTFTRRDDQHNKSQQAGHCVQDLHGEVMACGYEDVQVMWSILDKSQLTTTTTHHNQLEQTTHHFLREGIVR
ncbi:uncharacterized protein LOC131316325 [Rhododendron vialii]|uniref:uncharacterized protein LOC131316325 n=1 Tax=Rhododendron vialii TaxID=182163 RepID=UPI00265EE4F7|nr:uncharacterized protein LOC131316325 [Rhododendron vialii]